MQLEVGKILEGKVTGITKFGAFVELEPGTVGMVHISEVSNTYVNDIAEILKVGQTVSVKVLTVGDDKKISLSIKRTMAPEKPQGNRPPREGSNRPPREGGNRPPREGGNRPPRDGGSRPPREGGNGGRPQGGNRPGGAPNGGRTNGGNSHGSSNRGPMQPQSSLPKGPASFEDMLSKFMVSSDEKISGLKKDHTVSRRAGSKRK